MPALIITRPSIPALHLSSQISLVAVGIARAFAFQVADRGVPSLQGDAGVVGAFECAEGFGLRRQIHHAPVGAIRDTSHDVSVAADEAREKDSAPEIDNFDVPRRMRLNVRHGTNFLNAL